MSASTPTTAPDGAVHVVAAIIARNDEIFITRRASDSHQGGKWEFPGGKVDRGETAFDALRRELHEETGIDVRDARPFTQVHHAYPEKSVFLDVWQVTAWEGTAHGREGQAARWATTTALRPSEFPAADRFILRKLQLPGLYAISHADRYGKSGFLELLERALKGGVRFVQLREPQMTQSEYRDYACQAATLCHRYGAAILLNAEPEAALECGADGVHLNSRRLKSLDRRPFDQDYWVAASCHDAEELAHAGRIDVDFAVLSPVAKTASHPDAAPLGWETFSRLVAGVNFPIFALGGMGPADYARARATGAQGLAMVRGIWEAADMEGAVSALRADQPGLTASRR